MHWIYASAMFLLFSEYTVGRIREVHHKTGDTQCVNMPFNQIFKNVFISFASYSRSSGPMGSNKELFDSPLEQFPGEIMEFAH